MSAVQRRRVLILYSRRRPLRPRPVPRVSTPPFDIYIKRRALPLRHRNHRRVTYPNHIRTAVGFSCFYRTLARVTNLKARDPRAPQGRRQCPSP
jgi:hypothetical protein